MRRATAVILVVFLAGAWRSASPCQNEPLSPRDEHVIADLIRDLKHGEVQVRIEAAESLGVIGPPARAAVPVLLALLGEEDPNIEATARVQLGEAAARAVLEIGADHPAAGPALVRALGAAKPEARIRAMSTIEWLLDAGEVGHIKGGGHDPADVTEIVGKLGPAGPGLVPALIENLRAPDPKVRRAAVELLWDLGPFAAESVPALIATFDDPDEDVRAIVARALISVGPDNDAVVPALLRSRSTGELETRFAPWGRYRESHAPGDVQALAGVLRGNDLEIRRTAALCLWELGARSAPVLPALRAALKDPDEQVRLLAAGAVIARRPGDAEAVSLLTAALPRLARVLRSKGISSVTAVSFHADVLRHLGAKAGPEIPRLIRAGLGYAGQSGAPQLDAERTLAQLGSVAVPALKDALGSPEAHLRSKAALVLGRIGPASADAVPALVALLDDRELTVRHSAEVALGRIGPAARAALPALRRRLDVPDPAARVRMAALVWKIEPDPKLLTLFDEALKPEHPARWEAIRVFASLGAEGIPRLARLLKSADDRTGVAAYKALAAADPTRKAADATLSEMLADRDADVRRTAARVALEIGADARGCVPALERALDDDDVVVTGIAVDALVEIDRDNRAAIAYLIRRLSDAEDEHQRSEAAEQLGQCGDRARAAIPALRAAMNGPDGALRDAAILALWNLDRSEVPVFLRPRVRHPGGFR